MLARRVLKALSCVMSLHPTALGTLRVGEMLSELCQRWDEAETWCSLALPVLGMYRCTSLVLRAFCTSGRNQRTVSGIWLAKFGSNFHQVKIRMEKVNNERSRATGFVGDHFFL